MNAPVMSRRASTGENMNLERFHADTHTARSSHYHLSTPVHKLELQELLRSTGRTISDDRQLDLLRSYGAKDAFLYCTGNINLLQQKVVSIVGTRNVSNDGWRRATRLARELAKAGIVVMSGLAKGVDTAAHSGAMAAHGATAAVIGTPLQKAYPEQNAALQSQIAKHHLLISPFAEGTPVVKGNFPKRNRVMALLSDATVIIEASDTSGTLHQAAECIRQGRWLFILKSLSDNSTIKWPSRFLKDPKTVILSDSSDIFSRII